MTRRHVLIRSDIEYVSHAANFATGCRHCCRYCYMGRKPDARAGGGGGMSEICEDPGMMNHFEAVGFFNRLIIDLKLRELGEEHEPIIMERLEEASAHMRDISDCVRRVPIRRVQGEWLRPSGVKLEYKA